MMITMAGPGGGEALVQTTPTRETGTLRGRGEVATGGRNLINTQEEVMRGIVPEVEGEKGTAAGAGAARARSAEAAGAGVTAGAGARAEAEAGVRPAAAAGAGPGPGPGVVVAGGQTAGTEPFRVPNPNKAVLFLNDCTSYLLWLFHTWIEGFEFRWICESAPGILFKLLLFFDNYKVYSV